MIQYGSALRTSEQNDSLAKFRPFPTQKDLTILWSDMSADEIHALIRASHGWTRGAITNFQDEELRIDGSNAELLYTSHTLQPGSIVEYSDEYVKIACKNGYEIKTWGFFSDIGDMGRQYYASIGLNTASALTS